MTHLRPFVKRTFTPHEAVSELYRLKGILYNPELIEQFIHTVGVFPTGSLVELESGEVGMVFSINGTKRLRPEIIVILDKDKEPLDSCYQLNLSTHEDYAIKHSLARGAYGIDIESLLM